MRNDRTALIVLSIASIAGLVLGTYIATTLALGPGIVAAFLIPAFAAEVLGIARNGR